MPSTPGTFQRWTLYIPLWSAKTRSGWLGSLQRLQALVKYRVVHTLPIALLSSCGAGGRDSVPSQTTRFISRAEGETTANDAGVSDRHGRPGTILRLARRSHDRQAGDFGALASQRISEVWTWKSRKPGRPPLSLGVRELWSAIKRSGSFWRAMLHFHVDSIVALPMHRRARFPRLREAARR